MKIFELDGHKLILGDALEVLIELQEKYVEIGLNRLEITCDENKFYFKLSATDIACNKDCSSLLQTQLNTEN
ncbi:hypothetical protein [Microcoleus sp.]|uniref:hypothetical protein n=1 Tax=Microcoleus sp. TaxID=44472 RepID=UPI0035266BF0